MVIVIVVKGDPGRRINPEAAAIKGHSVRGRVNPDSCAIYRPTPTRSNISPKLWIPITWIVNAERTYFDEIVLFDALGEIRDVVDTVPVLCPDPRRRSL